MAQKYPEPTVGALIYNKDGKVLLVKSKKWGKKYTVPGGHIELGETAEEAIKREVKEEAGIEVEPIRLLLVQQAIYPKDFYKSNQHFIFLDYLCEAKSEDVRLDRRELQESFWVEPKEALKFDLESFTRFLVKEYLEGLPR